MISIYAMPAALAAAQIPFSTLFVSLLAAQNSLFASSREFRANHWISWLITHLTVPQDALGAISLYFSLLVGNSATAWL
jgi:hypothetical protein